MICRRRSRCCARRSTIFRWPSTTYATDAPRRRAAQTLLALLALGLAGQARADGVQLAGRMGERALVARGGQTFTLAAGEPRNGLTLLRWDGEAAIVRAEGASALLVLRPGAGPVSIGSQRGTAGVRTVTIPVGSGGHFVAPGAINGRPVRFMVDTGATVVAMGRDEALRLGLDLSGPPNGMSQTAGGVVPVHRLVLRTVRVGEVELSLVEASVVPVAMPYVLLGNSVLSRFQLSRTNDVMRLELK
jgi:aspartyl protease family protein